jgi:hypothetical protein
MIPHPTLDDEIFANDLRDRVSACRKRLRRNRVMQKQGSSRTARSGFQEHSAMRELLSSIEFRFHAVGVIKPGDSDTLLPLGEQEVGIT